MTVCYVIDIDNLYKLAHHQRTDYEEGKSTPPTDFPDSPRSIDIVIMGAIDSESQEDP